VSEIIEKVVASRIEDHFDKHKLHDNRQSAYRSDKAEPMATCCDLLLRYDFIHANADPDIPKVYSNRWYKIRLKIILTNINFMITDNQHIALKVHSTKTALLRVHHDIATALDNNSCSILVMLDLDTKGRFDTRR
jgi:hypothetical protein